MKTFSILCSAAAVALMVSCASEPATPPTIQGVVIDATMNSIYLKASTGDSVWLSTMDADPAKVPGVLVADSISVVYKDTADMKLVTELTVLRPSPYFYIQGQWVEDNPIKKTEKQGFSINADGSVSSINMATLQYNTWNFDIETMTLVLGGKSIGNRQTIEFQDTMHINKLNADSLVLARNNAVIYNLARQQ
ncbi:MAG: lipocalin family protein [Mucinivorans sp.]